MSHDSHDSHDRIACNISLSRIDSEDGLYDEIDRLADWLINFHRINGRDDVETCSVFDVHPLGSLLVQNSDAPDDTLYFWIDLPKDEPARQTVLREVLSSLSKARALCPGAAFSVSLESGGIRQVIDLF